MENIDIMGHAIYHGVLVVLIGTLHRKILALSLSLSLSYVYLSIYIYLYL